MMRGSTLIGLYAFCGYLLDNQDRAHSHLSNDTPAHAWCSQHLSKSLEHARICNGAEASLP